MANVIDSLNFDGVTEGIFTLPYGTCATAQGTAAKVATATNFVLEPGARIAVKFTYANTVASPTLNVNSTGAKAIYWHGTALASNQYWQAGAVLDFIYNGAQWELIGVAKDNNTTYGAAGSSLGLVKSGGDVTISNGTITVNDDSHSHDTRYYTEAEINNKISTINTAIDAIDWFNQGTAITSGADLNTYTTPGKYFIGSESGAQGLTNCPTSTNFCMYVLVRTSGGSKTQLIMTLNGRIYLRSCNSSSTWRDWQECATSASLDSLMPKSGGTFTGGVQAATTGASAWTIKNISIHTAGSADLTGVNTQRIVMLRK